MNEVCQYHEDRGKEIDRHTGQWKILLWGMGIFVSIMLFFVGGMYKAQEKIVTSVNKIDKTFTAYMAEHRQQTADIVRRVGNLEENCKDYDKRLRVIENRR